MNDGFGNNFGKVLSAWGTGQYRYPWAEHFALALSRGTISSMASDALTANGGCACTIAR
jgi:hypothetical protein